MIGLSSRLHVAKPVTGGNGPRVGSVRVAGAGAPPAAAAAARRCGVVARYTSATGRQVRGLCGGRRGRTGRSRRAGPDRQGGEGGVKCRRGISGSSELCMVRGRAIPRQGGPVCPEATRGDAALSVCS